MTKIAEAFIELRVDSEKAKRDAGDEARSVANEMTRAFASAFSAAAVVRGLSDAVQAASRLEQAVGGTAAIFGEAAGRVDDFAATSAESVGISEAAFRELSSQIGGVLNGLGLTQEEAADTSITLTQLGADLAAAFGGNPEEAVQALGAALRGEFNPLERFGVSLRQSAVNLRAVELGLAESTTAVDNNARAQATLSLIQEQTANVQGQFAREADTAAGKTAILTAKFEDAKAQLGAELLPTFVTGVELLTTLVDIFTELPGPVQTALVALVAIAGITAPIKRTVDAFGGLSNIIGKINPKFALAAVVAVGAVSAYQALTAKSRELEARTNDVSGALTDGAQALERAAIEAAQTETEVDDLAVAFQALNAALLTGEDGDKIVQALGTIGLQAEDTTEILLGLQADGPAALRSIGEAAGLTGEDLERFVEIVGGTDDQLEVSARTAAGLGEEYADVALAAEELQDQSEKIDLQAVAEEFLNAQVASDEFRAGLVEQAEANVGASRTSEQAVEVYREYTRLLVENAEQLDETTEATDDATRSVGALTTGLEDAEEELRNVEDSTLDAEDAFKDLDDAASALNDAFDDIIGRAIDLDRAYEEVIVGAENLTVTLGENGATLDSLTESGRANREAVREQVEAFIELGGELVRSGESTEDATEAVLGLRDGLIEQATQAGLTREEIEAYLEQLGFTPEEVNTAITVSEVEASKARIQEQLDKLGELPDEVATEIETLLDEEAYAEAERRLEQLVRARDITLQVNRNIRTTTSFLSPDAVTFGGLGQTARGGYFDRFQARTLAENNQPEAVLPLTRPNRLASLLADSRIGGPVAEAMAAGTAQRRTGASGGPLVSIGQATFVERSDVDAFAQAVNMRLHAGGGLQ